jgi:hypothetical protein
MAKRNVGFFDLHAEKLAVGACALLLLAAAYYSLGGARFKIEDKGPGDVINAVAESADQTRQALASARPAPPKEPEPEAGSKDPVSQLRAWFGESAVGLIKIARLAEPLPRTQPFPAPLQLVTWTAPEDRHQLARLVTPEIPLVVVGSTTLFFPQEKPELELYTGSTFRSEGKPAVRTYVSVAAQVDLTEQAANFIAERYPAGSYLPIVHVHLQRKDVDDSSGGWEDVETFLPFKSFKRPVVVESEGRARITGLEEFRRLVDLGGEYIARPKLPAEKAELPPVPLLDEAPKKGPKVTEEPPEQIAARRVKEWLGKAKDAMEARRPFDTVDLDAAYILSRAAAGVAGAKEKDLENARAVLATAVKRLQKTRKLRQIGAPPPAERLMPILAHDLDAASGKTYVYRIRYEIVNVYAGNRSELANPADADKVTLLSAWSPPSRPVEIKSDTYIFLTKADRAKREVTVTVCKVTRRGVNKKDFKVQVGEEIGKKDKLGAKIDYTTGLVCVDIDFDRVTGTKKDVAIVVLEKEAGAHRERLLSRDRQDKLLQRLTDQRSAGK